MTDVAAVREAALQFLARREHSRLELRQKLLRRFDQPDTVAQVINRLSELDLVSDSRFGDIFIRHKMFSGKGPYLIRQALIAKGLDADSVDAQLSQYDDQWLFQAQQAYQKKFRDRPVDDYRDRSKRLKFLLSRGYSSDICQRIVDISPDPDA